MPDDDEEKRLRALAKGADEGDSYYEKRMQKKAKQSKMAQFQAPPQREVTLKSVSEALKRRNFTEAPSVDMAKERAEVDALAAQAETHPVNKRRERERREGLTTEEKWQKAMDESVLANVGDLAREERYSPGGLYEYSPDPIHPGGDANREDYIKDLSKFPKQRIVRDKILSRELVTEKEYKEMGREWNKATQGLPERDAKGNFLLKNDYANKRGMTFNRLTHWEVELSRINDFIRARQKWAELNMPAPGSEAYYFGPKKKDDNEAMEKVEPRLPGRWRVKPK
tara:strand:+ start:823 stop:1671 length:849 start_codon:yes stop_codon:yes gene_type:complete